MHENKLKERERVGGSAQTPARILTAVALWAASFGAGCGKERSDTSEPSGAEVRAQNPVVIDSRRLVTHPNEYLGLEVRVDGFLTAAGFKVLRSRHACYEELVFRADSSTTSPGLSLFLRSHGENTAHPLTHLWADSLSCGPTAVTLTGRFQKGLVKPYPIGFDGAIQKR